MSGTFSISPAELHESGRSLTELGDGLDARRGSTLDELSAGDSTWGTDEAGSAFRGGYLDVLEAASEALRALAAGISDIGAAVEATARDTEAIDRAQADDLQRLLDEVL